jgi:hypothetical protein
VDEESVEQLESKPGQADASGWWLWLWVAVAVLIFYPLSVGPAVLLHQAFPAARPAIETVYQPLLVLDAKVPTFRKAIRWYVEKVWLGG